MSDPADILLTVCITLLVVAFFYCMARDRRASRLKKGTTFMNITPCGDRVLVRRCEDNGVTPGGIVIPDNAKQLSVRGTVIAKGPGTENHAGIPRPIPVEVGDVVLFGKFSGVEVDVAGEKYLMLRQDDIMGVVQLQS